MYRIAVCDDDERMIFSVRKCIEEWNPQIAVDCFSSGEALIADYKPYDAIFLDIDMGGMNGIETGRRIRQMDRETRIIYLTAYRDYVAGAFDVHAFQYILKPVSKKTLEKILKEIFSYVNTPEKKYILDFRTLSGMVCIPADEIYFFEYKNRKIRLVTSREEYFMADKIGSILERTKEFGFSMPHQSFVVNMLHVKNIRNQEILLDNGMVIPVAQKKQKSWKQELTVYLSKRLEQQRGGSI